MTVEKRRKPGTRPRAWLMLGRSRRFMARIAPNSSMRVVFAALVLLAPASVNAQPAGTILWSVELSSSPFVSQPTVAPDGTIYVHTGAFYAISPAGELLWSQPFGDANVADAGPDGTVYAGSDHTIFAYTPEGELLWSFTEPPGGQGIMAGPSIGPDGNIYAITDGGGLGALALSPQGELLWNTPGFVNFDGTGLTRVQFADDRLYFAEDIVPGCDPDGLQQGLVAVRLSDGHVEWCAPLSAAVRPTAAPNGRAYMRFALRTLRAYEPDGSIAWTFSLPSPSSFVIGPAAGPDNAAYLFRNGNQLWRIDPDGQQAWTIAIDGTGGFPINAVVSPDNSALIFGVGAGFEENGSVQALDPLTGALLWLLPLTGTTAGASATAEFSPDGSVVYVPASVSGARHLLAIQVHTHDGGSSLPGDSDGDGDVDLDDHTALVDCLTGPQAAPDPPAPMTPEQCLGTFDFDGDLDVDAGDFAAFQMTCGGSD